MPNIKAEAVNPSLAIFRRGKTQPQGKYFKKKYFKGKYTLKKNVF